MVKNRRELPDANELVVATVREIFDYGAYVTLDEFDNLRAYLPWSEVASRWVRDIRDVLREGQKIVVKVIRVNKAKKYVDVSLKRVYEGDKKRKMLEFKRKQRAEKILELTAQQIGKTLDDAYNEVGWPLEDYYGEIFHGLEEAAMRGEEALREAGIKDEWIEPLMNTIRKQIEIKKVKIEGVLILRSTKPNGVEVVKKILEKMKNVDEKAQINIYTMGAPKYKVEVISDNYKKAEKLLQKALSQAESIAKKEKAMIQFQRK